MFGYVELPGNFCKLVVDGRCFARVHALNDGSWVGDSGGGSRPSFTSEADAKRWLSGFVSAALTAAAT